MLRLLLALLPAAAAANQEVAGFPPGACWEVFHESQEAAPVPWNPVRYLRVTVGDPDLGEFGSPGTFPVILNVMTWDDEALLTHLDECRPAEGGASCGGGVESGGGFDLWPQGDGTLLFQDRGLAVATETGDVALRAEVRDSGLQALRPLDPSECL